MSHGVSLTRPAVFLDTNVLHLMNSYLRHAKTHGLPPYSETPMDYSEVRAVLRGHLPEGIANSIIKGCKVLAYIEKISESEITAAEVYTSRMCKLEVLCGVLDGQAHAQMAQTGGIPYRMRQRGKNLSELVSWYLKREDYEVLASELDCMFLELEGKLGIRVVFVEDEKDSLPAIMAFAELLQRNVFLDVIDCWMYGCAIAVQADLILTFDDYFKKVLNFIHNPQGEERESWLGLQGAVLNELATRLSGVSTAMPLSLPKAIELPQQTPRPW